MKLSLPLKENHEALWNWLAENPHAGKFDWPGFTTIVNKKALKSSLPKREHFLFHCCFACQSVPWTEDGSLNCGECPVEWGEDFCGNYGALYMCWQLAKNTEEKTKYARLIAKGWKK